MQVRQMAIMVACVSLLVPEPGTSWIHSVPWPPVVPAPRLKAHCSRSDDIVNTITHTSPEGNGTEGYSSLLWASPFSTASSVLAGKSIAIVNNGGEERLASPFTQTSTLFSSSRGRSGAPTTIENATGTLKGVANKEDTIPPAPASAASKNGEKPSDLWRARLTLVLVACLYGTNYTAIKFMGGLMDTSSLLTLRFGLAALVLLPSLRGVGRDVLLGGAEVGMYAAIGYGAQAYAMASLPASQLALVGSLAVLVAPFLDQVTGRRKAGVGTICAAGCACGGAALLQSAGIESGSIDQTLGLWPYALALMPPFFFGLSTWRMEAQVERHPGQALPLTAGQLAVVAISSAVWSIRDGGVSTGIPDALAHPGTDPTALAVLLWLGLVTTALVLFLETDALACVSASETAVIESLEPLVGAGLASSTLGEPFPSPLGASFVLGGCLCSSLFGGSTSKDADKR